MTNPMLTQEKNALFTQVGQGTPMGDLLRRYWHPIAACSEFEETPTKPVRLLGEDLVAFRDEEGRYGLIERRCPHRGADMLYGFTEKCGLRCSYHGWLLARDGRCVERPFEDLGTAEPSKPKCAVKAYPIEERAGLLWAYLGPQPAPLVPNWEPFTWKNGFVQIVFATIPCNWFQCQENSVDPLHFEWLHLNWSRRLAGQDGPYCPPHLEVDFREFDYGLTYHRKWEGTDSDDPLWSIGRVCLWPNGLFANGHMEWRVPVDDHTTLSVGWFFDRVPKDREPYVQARIPSWVGPVTDPATGRWITTHILNQDFVAWVGQGTVTDRTRENLVKSDRGIAMLRRMFLREIDTVAKGGDPKGVIRDPQLNACVPLPVIRREQYQNGMAREALAAHFGSADAITSNRFIFQAGQPDEVRRAYEEAMGFEMDDRGFV